MKTLIATCTIALSFTATAAFAELPVRTGRVQAIYVQAARGVMLDVRIARSAGGTLYADVAFDPPLTNRRDFAIARMDGNLHARIGDAVLVEFAAEGVTRSGATARGNVGVVAAETRVLAVVPDASGPYAGLAAASARDVERRNPNFHTFTNLAGDIQ